MSIRLNPSPHALPAAKPPSPVRPALKLAVRLNPDGAPALVLPPGHVPETNTPMAAPEALVA
jgi:hypothetical protein